MKKILILIVAMILSLPVTAQDNYVVVNRKVARPVTGKIIEFKQDEYVKIREYDGDETTVTWDMIENIDYIKIEPRGEKQEIVKLKNGKYLRGTITQYAAPDSIVLKEDDGTMHTVMWNDVEKVTREAWKPQSSFKKSFNASNWIQKGYRGFVDFEFLGLSHSKVYLGENKDEFPMLYGANTSHGYQFFPWLYVGIGTGVYFLKDISVVDYNGNATTKDFTIMPVFADVRLDFLRSKITPFLDLRGGKIVGTEGYKQYGSVSIGGRYALNKTLALNAAISLCIIRAEYVKRYLKNGDFFKRTDLDPKYPIPESEIETGGCLNLKFGVEF